MKLPFCFPLFAAATTSLLAFQTMQAQVACNFSDDFSNPTGWTQVGNLVAIQNGAVEYQSGAGDGEQRRVHKYLGTTLDAMDTWSAEVDFTPTMVGDNGGPFAGHAILALTAGTQEPFSDCPDIACTGYPTSSQDGLACFYDSLASPDGNLFFRLYEMDGGAETFSSDIIANDLNTPYFIRMERVSATLARLGVFSDAARTQHLPGSPVDLIMPATVEGLNTVQHANIARGYQLREMSGTVDNLCINWQKAQNCKPDRQLTATVGDSININTGVDENLNLLSFGTPDPRWTILSNTLPSMKALDRWNFTPVMSQWIGFDDNLGSNEAAYTVRFNFCTDTCGSYRFDFRMLADNGACVEVDGANLPSNWLLGNVPIADCSQNPGDQSPFIPTAGYQVDQTVWLGKGAHTLDINVVNFGGLTSINILGKIEVQSIKDCTAAAQASPEQTALINLFPNPAQDQIIVTWQGTSPRKLRLTDVLGRVIRSIEVPANAEQLEIPLDGLLPGLYFLQTITGGKSVAVKEFVKA